MLTMDIRQGIKDFLKKRISLENRQILRRLEFDIRFFFNSKKTVHLPLSSGIVNNNRDFSCDKLVYPEFGIKKYYEHLRPSVTIEDHKFAKISTNRKIVTIVYNYFKKSSTIFDSLKSIENQIWSEIDRNDVEIIIVDDGSEGEQEFVQCLPEDILYVWLKKNGYGICKAKNAGSRLANGDYILYLDPDIILEKNFIDNMVRNFRSLGDRIVQTGYIWNYYVDNSPDPRTEYGVWENCNIPTRRFFQVAGGCLALSRELYFKTPGFDEDLIYGGVEDLLFGYHLSKIPETTIIFNRNMECFHIPHPPGGAHANVSKSWNIVKSKWPEFYELYILRGLR